MQAILGLKFLHHGKEIAVGEGRQSVLWFGIEALALESFLEDPNVVRICCAFRPNNTLKFVATCHIERAPTVVAGMPLNVQLGDIIDVVRALLGVGTRQRVEFVSSVVR